MSSPDPINLNAPRWSWREIQDAIAAATSHQKLRAALNLQPSDENATTTIQQQLAEDVRQHLVQTAAIGVAGDGSRSASR